MVKILPRLSQGAGRDAVDLRRDHRVRVDPRSDRGCHAHEPHPPPECCRVGLRGSAERDAGPAPALLLLDRASETVSCPGDDRHPVGGLRAGHQRLGIHLRDHPRRDRGGGSGTVGGGKERGAVREERVLPGHPPAGGEEHPSRHGKRIHLHREGDLPGVHLLPAGTDHQLQDSSVGDVPGAAVPDHRRYHLFFAGSRPFMDAETAGEEA